MVASGVLVAILDSGVMWLSNWVCGLRRKTVIVTKRSEGLIGEEDEGGGKGSWEEAKGGRSQGGER